METSESFWSDADEYIRATVVKKHDATDDSQLNLRMNEIVIILEKDETGWWGGHKEGEERTGWFPGSCVRAIEVPDPKRALETGASSPVRRSFVVASPQRRSDGPERMEREADSRLLAENEQLKRDKSGLEAKLVSMRRQSDVEQQSSYQLRESLRQLEVHVGEQDAELRVERAQRIQLCEEQQKLQRKLQESVEQLEAEVKEQDQRLRSERDSKSELSEQNRQLRQRLQQQESTPQVPSSAPAVASPRPSPARDAREPEEVPAPGSVRQIRGVFERAATSTPQRLQARAAGVARSAGTLTRAATMGAAAQQDADFGMSPIRRGGKMRVFGPMPTPRPGNVPQTARRATE